MKEIFNRRSVRKYTEESVSDEDLKSLLQAAMRAPSAGNEQPWEFIIFKDQETKEKIMKFHPYAAFLNQAPCCILICGDLNRRKHINNFWVQDCSAAADHMLLEAEHLGLGAVWIGVYPAEERVEACAKLFHTPDHVLPFCIVALGHPAEKPGPIDTFRPERIHYEDWNGTDPE